MNMPIEIKDNAQVERINRVASRAPFEMWVSSGTVMLDARSLLGLMALVGKKARVVAGDCADPEIFGELVDMMN